jgi:hypothetical protein
VESAGTPPESVARGRPPFTARHAARHLPRATRELVGVEIDLVRPSPSTTRYRVVALRRLATTAGGRTAWNARFRSPKAPRGIDCRRRPSEHCRANGTSLEPRLHRQVRPSDRGSAGGSPLCVPCPRLRSLPHVQAEGLRPVTSGRAGRLVMSRTRAPPPHATRETPPP